jgi:N-acetylneuraminate lyase
MKSILSGLVAAPFTPFRQDGEVALDMIPPLARALAKNGVSGAFVCGTTGEGHSLTVPERKKVVEGCPRPSTVANPTALLSIALALATCSAVAASKLVDASAAAINAMFDLVFMIMGFIGSSFGLSFSASGCCSGSCHD